MPSVLPAFATPDDLEARGLDVSDRARAQAALDDASALIRVEAGPTAAWETIADIGSTYQDLIVAITCAVARRVLENAELVQSETQSLGDASQTRNYGDRASNDVFLKAGERRLIKRAAGGSTLGYVDLSIGTPGWTGDVIDVVGSDEPLPFTYDPLRP